ncbi:HD domain-containing protein [Sulfurisphaera ohwakuensis]|uniref:5'-deoxynucleotidase n=1 Tax=Sulfurisphaera ohwakuensis TaxID=69656 RepID=A0A650CEI0_SULOH|nr:HD family hydrolase [Sulfurisphaera ohwakuensis]MBB5252888.1 putative hydrolase of HD superfamily [Sulfurisphaera ohwakuensis]QGR16179.1 HD domain-containing protein [Sulfurisphaera ohwakuensis]
MSLERVITGCKNLVRTGWMQRGVPPSIGETVSQHSWEAAVLAYYLASKLKEKGVKINPERASVIALFHDVAESLLGDLPKWASERIEEKEEIELEAIKELGLDVELFIEYKEMKSLEGKIAKLCDRLSTYMQAKRYAKLGYDVSEITKTYEKEIENLMKDEKLSLIINEINNLIKNING